MNFKLKFKHGCPKCRAPISIFKLDGSCPHCRAAIKSNKNIILAVCVAIWFFLIGPKVVDSLSQFGTIMTIVIDLACAVLFLYVALMLFLKVEEQS